MLGREVLHCAAHPALGDKTEGRPGGGILVDLGLDVRIRQARLRLPCCELLGGHRLRGPHSLALDELHAPYGSVAERDGYDLNDVDCVAHVIVLQILRHARPLGP